MKLLTVAAIVGLAAPVLPYTVTYTLTYNPIYDGGQSTLNMVACSNGEYGLVTAGYTTYDTLPTFPYIGGAPQILGWNSPYCGTCWQLTFTDPQGVSTSLNVTAVDVGDSALDGFDISLEGMNVLTNDEAARLGRVPITATRLPKGACGL